MSFNNTAVLQRVYARLIEEHEGDSGRLTRIERLYTKIKSTHSDEYEILEDVMYKMFSDFSKSKSSMYATELRINHVDCVKEVCRFMEMSPDMGGTIAYHAINIINDLSDKDVIYDRDIISSRFLCTRLVAKLLNSLEGYTDA